MVLDVRLNGKERSGEKRRVFVCRLTDGRIAVLAPRESDIPTFYPTLTAVKQDIAVLVPDIRIPIYDEYELKGIGRSLGITANA